VREVTEAGADLVLFTPLFDDDAGQMQQLASQAIPQLD